MLLVPKAIAYDLNHERRNLHKHGGCVFKRKGEIQRVGERERRGRKRGGVRIERVRERGRGNGVLERERESGGEEVREVGR